MEPLTLVVDKFNSLAKSSKEFVKSVIHHLPSKSYSRNPIEILKRLQREAFSDLMKLRERQDKLERMISFYTSSKGSPFREATTHMKGEIDVVGALLFVRDIGQQTLESLSTAGIRTGVNSKFTFETLVRQNDSLVVELVARHNSESHCDSIFGSSLALTKVMYLANVNDWFSLAAIPVGAQCKDIALFSNPLQRQGLTELSSFGPPLFSHYHDCAAGIMVKRSNFAASLAEFVSMQPGHMSHDLSTFAQCIYQPSDRTKLTLSGIHRMSKPPTQQFRLGSLVLPVTRLRSNVMSDTSLEASRPSAARNTTDCLSSGSISLMLEAELDESSKIGGWVQLAQSSSKCLQWSVSLSDIPEGELGWGVSMSGMIQGPSTGVNSQFEAFLKFSLGKRFSLQPGLVYAMHDGSGIPAVMLRSSWSL